MFSNLSLENHVTSHQAPWHHVTSHPNNVTWCHFIPPPCHMTRHLLRPQLQQRRRQPRRAGGGLRRDVQGQEVLAHQEQVWHPHHMISSHRQRRYDKVFKTFTFVFSPAGARAGATKATSRWRVTVATCAASPTWLATPSCERPARLLPPSISNPSTSSGMFGRHHGDQSHVFVFLWLLAEMFLTCKRAHMWRRWPTQFYGPPPRRDLMMSLWPRYRYHITLICDHEVRIMCTQTTNYWY